MHTYRTPHPIPAPLLYLCPQAGSASRARGPAATPGSGYAADRSAGPARTTKARARTRPPAAGSAAGAGTGHGAEQNAAAGEEKEVPVDGWACGTCTLVNKARVGKCNACGAARPRRPPRARGAPAVSAVGSGGSAFYPPAAVKSPPDLGPSEQGGGFQEEEEGGGDVVSADVVDSPGGPWEG